MHTGKVEIIGIDTSRLAVLSEQEKLELLQRARNGDKAARDGFRRGAKTPTTCSRWAASA